MRLLGFKNLRGWDQSFRWAMLMIAAFAELESAIRACDELP